MTTLMSPNEELVPEPHIQLTLENVLRLAPAALVGLAMWVVVLVFHRAAWLAVVPFLVLAVSVAVELGQSYVTALRVPAFNFVLKALGWRGYAPSVMLVLALCGVVGMVFHLPDGVLVVVALVLTAAVCLALAIVPRVAVANRAAATEIPSDFQMLFQAMEQYVVNSNLPEASQRKAVGSLQALWLAVQEGVQQQARGGVIR